MRNYLLTSSSSPEGWEKTLKPMSKRQSQTQAQELQGF